MTHYLRLLLAGLCTVALFVSCGGEDAPKAPKRDYLDGKTFETVFRVVDEVASTEVVFSASFARSSFTFSIEQRVRDISDESETPKLEIHEKSTMVGQYEYAQGMITLKNKSGIEEDFIKGTKRPALPHELEKTDGFKLIVSEQAHTITAINGEGQALLLALKTK